MLHRPRFISPPAWGLLLLVLLVALANSARAQPAIYDSLKYADVGGHPLHLWLHVPEGASALHPVPCVVWIHGGGWLAGDALPIPRWVLRLVTEENIAVASVEYRLTSQEGLFGSEPVIFPAQIHDVKGAVRWLRAHAADYGLDASRFGAWGNSSGGHLAALLGTSGGVPELEGVVGGNPGESSEVQAFADFYGPTDILNMTLLVTTPPGCLIDHDAPDSPESRLVGWSGDGQGIGDIRAHAGDPTDPYPALLALTRAANPITHVDPSDPPAMIAHGDADTSVPFGMSRILADALAAAGVAHQFRTVPGAGHEDLGDPTESAAIEFFASRLEWSARRDLVIEPSDLVVTPAVPGCGDTLSVCATIHAYLSRNDPPVPQAVVRFYDGDVTPAREIHADTLRNLEDLSVTPVCFSWLPPPDSSALHLIVLVDGEDAIPEVHETNNMASADVAHALDAPVLIAPDDESGFLPDSLFLVWNRIACADHYRLQLATDSTFTTGILVDQGSVQDTTLVVGSLVRGVRHFWRVRSEWPPSAGAWSSTFRFVTAPDPVALIHPGDTNQDGNVDARDVLPIGLHYGRSGPARPAPSLQWTSQPLYESWDPAAAAYADCDGNGAVAADDVLGVIENWGATTEGTPPGTDREAICAALLRMIDQAPANPGLAAIRAVIAPPEFQLEPNAPDPFVQGTTWRFTVPVTCDAGLSVFDTSGRLVWRARLGRVSPGTRIIRWDGRSDSGVRSPAGIYFYRLTAGSYRAAGKMVMLP